MNIFKILTLIYAILYVLWTVYGIYDDFKCRPFKNALLFCLAGAIGVSGIIFYFLNIQEPILKYIWKFLFVIFIIGETLSFKGDIKEFNQDETFKAFVPFIIVMSIILMIPVVWINFIFAYY